jgi:hypothetical protein
MSLIGGCSIHPEFVARTDRSTGAPHRGQERADESIDAPHQRQ